MRRDEALSPRTFDLGNFSLTVERRAFTFSAKSLKVLVGRLGLEPRTTGLKGQCSDQLS